jgi:hypothetical protein
MHTFKYERTWNLLKWSWHWKQRDTTFVFTLLITYMWNFWARSWVSLVWPFQDSLT